MSYITHPQRDSNDKSAELRSEESAQGTRTSWYRSVWILSAPGIRRLDGAHVPSGIENAFNRLAPPREKPARNLEHIYIPKL